LNGFQLCLDTIAFLFQLSDDRGEIRHVEILTGDQAAMCLTWRNETCRLRKSIGPDRTFHRALPARAA
jgi:hypothetical protein